MINHAFHTVSAKVEDTLINKDDGSIVVYQHPKHKEKTTMLGGDFYINNKFVGVATTVSMPEFNNGGAL